MVLQVAWALSECLCFARGPSVYLLGATSVFYLENPMNSIKRQNDRILKEELPRSLGAQHTTGDQWRNNCRKNEDTEPKQKQHPLVVVTGNGSKV